MEVSAAEFARFLGVSRAHISKLLKNGVLKPLPGRGFDLATAVRGYIAYLKAGIASARVANQRAGYLLEQARRLRIQNDMREGKLMLIGDHDAVLMVVLNTVRQGALNLPGRCAKRISDIKEPSEIKALLDAEVDAFLNECASELERQAQRKVAELAEQ